MAPDIAPAPVPDLLTLGGLQIRSQPVGGSCVSLSFDLTTRDGKLLHLGRLSLMVEEYRQTLAPILRMAARKERRILFEDDARPPR